MDSDRDGPAAMDHTEPHAGKYCRIEHKYRFGADHLLPLRRSLHRPAHRGGFYNGQADQKRTKTLGGDYHGINDLTRIPAELLVADNITACRASRFPDVRSGRTVVYLFPAAQ